MPNYEFGCADCGKVFEEKLNISERDKPRKCPSCGSENVKRSFGNITVSNYRRMHFKTQSGEFEKPKHKIHLGYETKPKRWGFSKWERDERRG